jgi:hypothetical protein
MALNAGLTNPDKTWKSAGLPPFIAALTFCSEPGDNANLAR